MSEVRDLDAAVAEKLGEPRTYRVAGREFTLPARLPLGLAAAVQSQDFDRIGRVLASGDSDLAEHLMNHLTDLHLEAIAEDYGLRQGESDASAG